jgi:hypothetical protein
MCVNYTYISLFRVGKRKHDFFETPTIVVYIIACVLCIIYMYMYYYDIAAYRQ